MELQCGFECCECDTASVKSEKGLFDAVDLQWRMMM